MFFKFHDVNEFFMQMYNKLNRHYYEEIIIYNTDHCYLPQIIKEPCLHLRNHVRGYSWFTFRWITM